MRNRQGITIAALIIAIIGLSIGFAAFSNTLTIRSSATVNPDSSALRVVFSLDDDSEDAGTTGDVHPNNSTYGDNATITNSAQGTTGESLISGLHAKFTAPGQSVTYSTIANPSLYVFNAGSLQAQLTGITYNNVTSYSSYKKCTAVDYLSDNDDTNDHLQATASLVAAACEGISISVKVGNATTNPSSTSLNGQIINVGASLPVEITISYASGSAYADGAFEVAFGDIEISATSAVNPNAVVTPQQPEEETNLWKTRGLTSSNVEFGTTYTVQHNDTLWVESFELLSNGSISLDEDVLDEETVGLGFMIGSNYFILDVSVFEPGESGYQAIEFLENGQAIYYPAPGTITLGDEPLTAIKNYWMAEYGNEISERQRYIAS